MTSHLYDEKEVMEEFISCYKHFTALWDSSSPDYMCKKKKDPGYIELLKILQRVNGTANVQDVKRKINSLRCCFRREVKKMQHTYEGYEPRLWWFHLMDFLKPVLNIQEPAPKEDYGLEIFEDSSTSDDDFFSDSFNEEEDAQGQKFDTDTAGGVCLKTEIELDNSAYHPHASQSANTSGVIKHTKMRRQRRSSDEQESPGFRKRRRAENFVEDADSECDLIGRRMAAHFRNMRPDQRLYAERIISEVLVYGRMNRLGLEARFLPNGTASNK